MFREGSSVNQATPTHAISSPPQRKSAAHYHGTGQGIDLGTTAHPASKKNNTKAGKLEIDLMFKKKMNHRHVSLCGVYMHVYAHMFMHSFANGHMHAYKHAWVHAYTHAHTRTRRHICTLNCASTRANTVHMPACTHTCARTRAHTYTSMHARACSCTRACVRGTHACMHAHMHAQTSRHACA